MNHVDVRKFTCGQARLLKEIEERQLRILGPVSRKQQLEDLAVTGKIEGEKLDESRGLASYNRFREVPSPSSMLPEVENLRNFLQMRQSTSVNRYDLERRRY